MVPHMTMGKQRDDACRNDKLQDEREQGQGKPRARLRSRKKNHEHQDGERQQRHQRALHGIHVLIHDRLGMTHAFG